MNAEARVHVLQHGSTGARVRSTVTLVIDGEAVIVIDPGMAPSQAAILDPLAGEGFAPLDVTDVVVSHHHPDHTVNVGLFGGARVHDHWATYHHDVWTSRPAEGLHVSPSVVLWSTPGHTLEDITTVIGTADGVVAATHLWWSSTGPAEDPLATHPALIHDGRRRVLKVAGLVVPGHGSPFRPDSATPD